MISGGYPIDDKWWISACDIFPDFFQFQIISHIVVRYAFGINALATYKAQNMTCDYKKTKLKAASISGYEHVPKNNEKALMKAAANQPVSIALDSDDEHFQHYSSGVLTGKCKTDLSHGVVAVGYGKTKTGLKYWIMENSWGSYWGENGYFRIQKDVKDKRGQCGLAIKASYPII